MVLQYNMVCIVQPCHQISKCPSNSELLPLDLALGVLPGPSNKPTLYFIFSGSPWIMRKNTKLWTYFMNILYHKDVDINNPFNIQNIVKYPIKFVHRILILWASTIYDVSHITFINVDLHCLGRSSQSRLRENLDPSSHGLTKLETRLKQVSWDINISLKAELGVSKETYR